MSTLAGAIFGIVLLTLAVFLGGGWKIFLNIEALMIVLGGTIAATLISFPFSRVVKFFTLVIRLFGEQKDSGDENLIGRIVVLAHKAQQHSIFSLEKEAKNEPDRYLRMGLQLLVRGATHARIARRFAAEMDGVRHRHKAGIQLFGFMAKISPSFGLVGTLIGLINMLRGIGEQVSPETLGPSMAVALVTTLYGALLAFFLFLPASEKLKAYSENELGSIQMVRDAILMIKDGDSSRDLEDMLNSHLPPKRRRSFVNELILSRSRNEK